MGAMIIHRKHPGDTVMNQTKKTLRNILFWAVCALLILAGLFFQFAVVGYSFSALVCFCLAALLLCYKLLSVLIQKNKPWAKAVRTVLNICLCIGLTIVTVTGCFIGVACFGDSDVHCDYVVVLGAGLHGSTPSLSLRSRIDAAYTYLSENPDTVCIVSGGQGPGEDMTEAQCMYNELSAMGIDPSRIWMEDRSTSTQENLRFSMELIEEKSGQRPYTINLISNEYHLLRAKMFARDEGVVAYGVPAKTPYVSLFINYFLREIAGVWHHILLGG